jgi:multidrug efflux pump subunit AcrB
MINLAARARPYFGAVVVASIFLTLWGFYAATRLASGIFPEVTFPRIAVVARVPGLAVANMEIQVTLPLEQAVRQVLGVQEVRSKTIRGGSELSLIFSPDTDMLRAEQLTWNRIGAIRSQLPPDVELSVERMTPAIFPILSLVLTGGDNPSQLRDYAYYHLAPLIKNSVPDILYANVAGGDIREIIVEPRPDDLLAAGLSAADLAEQIGKAHRLQPIGRVERPPLAYALLVNTQGETVQQIADLVLQTRGGHPLRVRDVAEVKVLHQDRVQSIGFAGRDAVVITIFRQPGGNTVRISQGVRELLAHQPLPRNIQATIAYDQATLITTAVDNVRDAIAVGSFFSILILLGFLRSLRATLVAAVALPTTLGITFLILWALGETLNLMSLGGLAVAIGLIIDDTVVVVENIARHTSAQPAPGEDPVLAASAEITGAVVGSTLTTVLVFVPLAFITGVYGQFFISLCRSLAVAVLVSMVISLTLIPVLAARFLGQRRLPAPGRWYHFCAGLYEKALAAALRFPRTVLAASLLALLLGWALYSGIPNPWDSSRPLLKRLATGLLPEMDEGAFVLDYFAPPGTPLEQTEALARTIERILLANPDVQSYVRRTGAELGLFATRTNRGDIQVVLRPAEEGFFGLFRRPVRPPFSQIEEEMKRLGRQRAEARYGPHYTPEQLWQEGKAAIREKYRRRSAAEVRREIEEELTEHFSEHQLRFETMPILQDELDDLSGANRPIEVKVFGPERQRLRELAEQIGELLEKRGKGHGLKEVLSYVNEGTPDLEVVRLHPEAIRRGLTAQEVERQLRALFLGQVATQVRESALRLTEVRVRYPDAFRFGARLFSPSRLLEQGLLLPPGAVPRDPLVPDGLVRRIPVSAAADIRIVRTPEEVWRENQQPVHIITAERNEEEAGLGEVVEHIRSWLKEVPLPAGYRWELGGHYRQQQEAFRSLLGVMLIAILLVFLMLAVQFRSLLLPLLIFLTQPLSLVSGLLALWLTDTPLNLASYMGAILLVGLDMKNGILLVEHIQQLLARGMPLEEALLQAGRTRFRPILMTSLAAILGLLPLALGLGPGAQMQQPLAILVIGGLTANMLFTRMIIPVGYLLVARGQRRQPATGPARPA